MPYHKEHKETAEHVQISSCPTHFMSMETLGEGVLILNL